MEQKLWEITSVEDYLKRKSPIGKANKVLPLNLQNRFSSVEEYIEAQMLSLQNIVNSKMDYILDTVYPTKNLTNTAIYALQNFTYYAIDTLLHNGQVVAEAWQITTTSNSDNYSSTTNGVLPYNSQDFLGVLAVEAWNASGIEIKWKKWKREKGDSLMVDPTKFPSKDYVDYKDSILQLQIDLLAQETLRQEDLDEAVEKIEAKLPTVTSNTKLDKRLKNLSINGNIVEQKITDNSDGSVNAEFTIFNEVGIVSGEIVDDISTPINPNPTLQASSYNRVIENMSWNEVDFSWFMEPTFSIKIPNFDILNNDYYIVCNNLYSDYFLNYGVQNNMSINQAGNLTLNNLQQITNINCFFKPKTIRKPNDYMIYNFKNYKLFSENNLIENKSAFIEKTNSLAYFGSNDKGVLSFNGEQILTFTQTGVVYSSHIWKNKLYISCAKGIFDLEAKLLLPLSTVVYDMTVWKDDLLFATTFGVIDQNQKDVVSKPNCTALEVWNDELYIGTSTTGLWNSKEENILPFSVTDIIDCLIVFQNELYIGTRTKGVINSKGETIIPKSIIGDPYRFAIWNDELYIGTQSYGLFNSKGENILPESVTSLIYSLYVFQNELYIGTRTKGVINSKGETIIPYATTGQVRIINSQPILFDPPNIFFWKDNRFDTYSFEEVFQNLQSEKENYVIRDIDNPLTPLPTTRTPLTPQFKKTYNEINNNISTHKLLAKLDNEAFKKETALSMLSKLKDQQAKLTNLEELSTDQSKKLNDINDLIEFWSGPHLKTNLQNYLKNKKK